MASLSCCCCCCRQPERRHGSYFPKHQRCERLSRSFFHFHCCCCCCCCCYHPRQSQTRHEVAPPVLRMSQRFHKQTPYYREQLPHILTSWSSNQLWTPPSSAASACSLWTAKVRAAIELLFVRETTTTTGRFPMGNGNLPGFPLGNLKVVVVVSLTNSYSIAARTFAVHR